MKTKVEHLAPNQTIISTPQGTFFQSYDSIIAHIDNDENITLDVKYWNYSMTTGKYRNKFLGEDKKTTQSKIDSGKYKLLNLN